MVDADELAREAVAPGSQALAGIVETFGRGVLDEVGQLDRKQLARRVFGDESALRELNRIVHPRVRALAAERFAALAAQGHPLACYEVPLLFETGQAEHYRPVVVVSVSLTTQRQRAAARDGASAEQVQQRIERQIPLADKVARADFVIDNEADLAATERAADEVLRGVCRRLGLDDSRYFSELLRS